MIRVVVVDDEALVRSGFGLILGASEDIEVVATASGGEAVATVRRERPDVVLLDLAHLVRTPTAAGVVPPSKTSRTLLHSHPPSPGAPTPSRRRATASGG